MHKKQQNSDESKQSQMERTQTAQANKIIKTLINTDLISMFAVKIKH